MDVETRRVLAEFQRELTRLGRENDALKRAARGPQLAHSSLEEGQALEVRSGDGATRQIVGWLPDGTVGMVTEGGDPVSAPSVPIVTPSLGGLRVAWDGTLSGDVALPGDFDHMAVHVSTTSGFVPSAATYVGSIRRAGEGGMLPVIPLPYQPHYVKLVPVTTGGVQGTPSAEVSATPLQVDGPDLTAGSVEAAHIKAGAVEADKLEAMLVLASTIIAGIPGAARVELDQDGLRGYNTANVVVFAIDSAGNAVFTGKINGSDISGSQITIDSGTGSVGFIGESSGIIQSRVTSSGGARAQLSASDVQAEYTAWANPFDPTAPMGGMLARSDRVALTMQSVAADFTKPYTEQHAFSGEARTRWSSGGGSEVLIRALPDYASILLTAPPAVDPDDAQSGGYLYAQRYSTDIAATAFQGPEWTANTGPEYRRRSGILAEGARPERPYTRLYHSAQRHVVYGESLGDVYDTTTDGVLDIADTHSILAPRHQPVQSSWTGQQPTFATGGSFVDFTAAEWPAINFRTSWSGKVRITVQSGGINHNTDASSLATTFRLSGGSSVPASLSRCAYMQSRGAGANEPFPAVGTFFLQLAGNADYTLTPVWRISSGDSSTAAFSAAFDNTITVERLT